MNFKYLIFSISMCLLFSCKTKKYSTPEVAEINSIKISHGGGFAGRYTKYIVLENGQIFRSCGTSENFVEIDNISKSKAKGIFKRYNAMEISKEEMNLTGNMTYDVTFKNKKGDKIYQSWPEEMHPEKLETLYKYIHKTILPKGEKHFNHKSTEPSVKADIL